MELDMYQQAGGDFQDKELRGISCWRQMKSVSTLILVLQMCFLTLMIEDNGLAPKSQNNMIGPYITTLVSNIGSYIQLFHICVYV